MDEHSAESYTALITGATGYIGSNVVRRLAEKGWKVHVIARETSKLTLLQPVNKKVRINRHDGSTEEMFSILDRVRPDVVFHLAAIANVVHSPKQIVPMLTSNILFGTQLVEAMIAAGSYLLVNTGTYSQHYGQKPYSPSSLYDATKQAFKDILTFYTETTPLKAVTLELYDNYGPGDPRNKIMSLLLKSAKDNQPLAMTPGEQLIDLVYIDDIVDAYELCAHRMLTERSLKNEVYALSSQNPIRLKDVVETFEKVCGCPLPVQWGARPYRQREIMVPWNQGNRLPGWKAKVALEVGIRKMLDFSS